VTGRSPKPAVVDASALIDRLLGGRRGAAVDQAVGQSAMVAPSHVDLEVLNAMRRLVRAGEVHEDRAAEAAQDLREAPLERVDISDLIPRIWAWRSNLSAYDAAYVAVAEVLECPLVTADAGLARAARRAVAVVTI
jgi:predicted nucleic acid-binding protein